MEFWLKGLIVGFSIAGAGIGPIGLLCIKRTLTVGRLAGFVSGLGAATADAFYGLVAGSGLMAVSGFLLRQQGWLRIIGAIFLGYLGLKTFLTPAPGRATVEEEEGLVAAYASTLALTLTNPVTILFFATIFAGAGLPENYSAIVWLMTGVFCGSALWWLLLSNLVGLVRRRLPLNRVNQVSGLLLLGFGLALLFATI